MPTAAAELKRLLGEFNARHGPDLSMVVSRTGAPIAHEGQSDMSLETFASLAATLMNAAEVLYTGLGRTPPDRVVAESEGGTLVATALGPQAMLVAVRGKRAELLRGVEEMTAGIRDVMAAKP